MPRPLFILLFCLRLRLDLIGNIFGRLPDALKDGRELVGRNEKLGHRPYFVVGVLLRQGQTEDAVYMRYVRHQIGEELGYRLFSQLNLPLQ